MKHVAVLALLLAPALARAQPEIPDAPPPPAEPPGEEPPLAPEPTPAAPTPEEMAERIDQLEDRVGELTRQKAVVESTREQTQSLWSLRKVITAWIDVGAFAVAGNGAGIRSDFLHAQYPEYRNTISGQWVFMGDPFSTMINSLGEPADTADSREVETDTVNSSGRPSLIVNTVALALDREIGKGVGLTGLVLFLPRPGDDQTEVALAHADYHRTVGPAEVLVEVGKIDSVLGIEYRNQDAPRRIGVTPSLICRYECGRPLGADIRAIHRRVEDGHPTGWSLSAAITSGDTFDERFEPKPALRANRYPTLAAHAQYTLPYHDGLELGVSAAFGPQDAQSDTGIHQWHYGFDLRLADDRGWNVTAEFVQGHQQGSTTGDPAIDQMSGIERPACDLAPCLSYKGAYVFAYRNLTPHLLVYARADWRDATHRDGADFVYESRSLRGTVGARYKLVPGVVGKLEYVANEELGVPYFPHDVITASIVLSTDP